MALWSIESKITTLTPSNEQHAMGIDTPSDDHHVMGIFTLQVITNHNLNLHDARGTEIQRVYYWRH